MRKIFLLIFSLFLCILTGCVYGPNINSELFVETIKKYDDGIRFTKRVLLIPFD
jgi:hypothetical protein